MFTTASFIYPKFVINSFDFDAKAIEKICGKYVHFYLYFETKNKLSKENFQPLTGIKSYLTDDFYGFL